MIELTNFINIGKSNNPIYIIDDKECTKRQLKSYIKSKYNMSIREYLCRNIKDIPMCKYCNKYVRVCNKNNITRLVLHHSIVLHDICDTIECGRKYNSEKGHSKKIECNTYVKASEKRITTMKNYVIDGKNALQRSVAKQISTMKSTIIDNNSYWSQVQSKRSITMNTKLLDNGSHNLLHLSKESRVFILFSF